MQIARFIPPFLKPDPKGPWKTIARLFREGWRKYLPGYAVASFFMVFVAGTTALTAWIIGDVVDQVFIDRDVTKLIILAGGVVFISLVRGISLYGSTVAITRTGNAVVADMQKRVYNHILDLGIAYFDRTHSSMLIAAVSNRAGSASAVLSTVLTSAVRDLLSVVGLVTVMIIKSPWLSLLVIVIGPLALIGIGGLVHRIRAIAKSEFAGMTKIIASMQETAAGVRVVKAFNLESAMRARMTHKHRVGSAARQQDCDDQGPDLAADGNARRPRRRRCHPVGRLRHDLSGRKARRLHVLHHRDPAGL